MADLPSEVTGAAGEKTSGKQLLRGLIIGILIFLVYAFAVQATQIDLEKPLDPGRQENVTRVLRLLADPDIVSIDDDTGSWGLSEATRITIERIIETIFMALLASTIGTALAVPVSFLAARNLMEDVTAPLGRDYGSGDRFADWWIHRPADCSQLRGPAPKRPIFRYGRRARASLWR